MMMMEASCNFKTFQFETSDSKIIFRTVDVGHDWYLNDNIKNVSLHLGVYELVSFQLTVCIH